MNKIAFDITIFFDAIQSCFLFISCETYIFIKSEWKVTHRLCWSALIHKPKKSALPSHFTECLLTPAVHLPGAAKTTVPVFTVF